MNAPLFDRSRVYAALDAVGERYGLRISNLLPTGIVSHHSDRQPVVFLADSLSDDLSLLDLCSAEEDLQDSLGYATRILLRSELGVSPGGQEILTAVRGL